MQSRPTSTSAPLCRLYLRASTAEQDAGRARGALEQFAHDHGLRIVGTYIERESGTRLDRPELWRLLADSHPGDVLLTEQIDRLSRLTDADWRRLRAEIEARKVRVVALDLPTSHKLAEQGNEFGSRMQAAINSMMMDMLAAIARKDYSDRRCRQADGQARAKERGVYKGRVEDTKRNTRIAEMLGRGMSWTAIMEGTKCSRATVARIAKRLKGERPGG